MTTFEIIKQLTRAIVEYDEVRNYPIFFSGGTGSVHTVEVNHGHHEVILYTGGVY